MTDINEPFEDGNATSASTWLLVVQDAMAFLACCFLGILAFRPAPSAGQPAPSAGQPAQPSAESKLREEVLHYANLQSISAGLQADHRFYLELRDAILRRQVAGTSQPGDAASLDNAEARLRAFEQQAVFWDRLLFESRARLLIPPPR